MKLPSPQKLQETLEQAQQAQELAEQLPSLQSKVEHLKAEYAKLDEKKQAKLSAIQKEVDSAQKEANTTRECLRVELSAIRDAKVLAEGELFTLQTKVTSLQREAEELPRTMAAAHKALVRVNKDLAAQELKLLNVCSDLKDASEQLAEKQQKIAEAGTTLKDTEQQLASVQTKLTETATAYEEKKEQCEEELKIILFKTSEAVARLQALQLSERATLENLAQRSKELDLREDVINRRDTLTTDAANRVARRSRLMKL